ncbi:ABC transporter substrate-binding protein [Candidatus Peregrinibacteria bacterium]|nr:ABC transporter substrate-binding protein [Candidatus Peregrinibacteria bacterium]
MTKWERIALAVLVLFFAVSFVVLLRKFYVENTMLVPSPGGTYIEGSVGELQQLNPWFTVTNDVNRDVVSLVFAGLLKYNPATKKIEEDLATMEVTSDGLIYRLKLKEGLFWHDSTEDDPHPVTADDVIYTFGVTQDSQFPNTLLQQNFRGVEIEKIDDRTVRFRLEEPYSFFPSNLTLGLLPKRSFEGVPINRLNETFDFSLDPVGAGPYKLRSIVQTELSTEVTLERFPRTIEPLYKLDRVVMRIFPDYQTLLTDLRNLDGVRRVPRNKDGEPLVPRRFEAITYTLPQYVALFLNLDRAMLKDENLRLGLQLGTNKQEIGDAIKEPMLVDTPLLEIDVSDWRYHYDAEAAQGALFVSNWNLPEKLRLQRLLEQREANDVGMLKIEPTILLDTGAVLTLTGSMQRLGTGAAVNGIAVKRHPTHTGSWIVQLPTRGTGSLRLGENLIRLTQRNGNIVDSFYLWRTTNIDEFKRAREEQRLVQLFLDSRAGTIPAEKRIMVQNLTLERGMLRTRLSTDPVSIRKNDAGDALNLRLLTSPSPEKYRQVAEMIQKQWAALGVQVTIDIPASEGDFEQKLIRRDYDVLLFGQSLLDNLDSFPYWHSSNVQKLTGKREDLRRDAYNLAHYSSFKADALLETIRSTSKEKERQDALGELRTILKNDVPAIFLYSPLYTYAHQENILGINPGSLSLHSDRFLTLHQWYVKEERVFKAGKSWFSFVGWLPSIIR